MDAVLCGRIEEVQCALRTKELQRTIDGKSGVHPEGLVIKKKGKNQKFKEPERGQKDKVQFKGKSANEKKVKKCSINFCDKIGHFKKDCYDWKKKQ